MRVKGKISLVAVIGFLLSAAAPQPAPLPAGMLEAFLRFDGWAIGGDLTPIERDQLAAFFAEAWQRDPAGLSAKATQVERLSPRLHPGRLTPEDGILRERLWEGAAKATDPMVGREVAILADNPAVIGTEGNRGATQASVLAFIAAEDIIRTLAGLPAMTETEQRATLEDARRQWPSLSPEDRERLFDATGHLQQLKAMLADPTMRAGVLRDIKAHVHRPGDVAAMTVAQEDVASRFAVREAELGREANRQAAEMMYIGMAQHFYLTLK